MAKRRASGEGSIRKRKDGRYTAGHNPKTGKAIVKNVLAKTQAEVRDKLKRAHQIKRPPTGGLFIWWDYPVGTQTIMSVFYPTESKFLRRYLVMVPYLSTNGQLRELMSTAKPRWVVSHQHKSASQTPNSAKSPRHIILAKPHINWRSNMVAVAERL